MGPLPAPSPMSGSTDPSLTQLPTKMSLIDLAPSPPEAEVIGNGTGPSDEVSQ